MVGLSGCTRSINDVAPQSTAPQALPSAPVESVQSTNNLPPPVSGTRASLDQGGGTVGAGNPQFTPTAPTAPTATVTAAAASVGDSTTAETAIPVTREAVSGTWQVVSDSSSCRMILAFTKWQGGYRAATRKCSSPELGKVSAWDVKGKQVILMDASGNAVGRLYGSGKERYDGTTNSGAPIVFTRS